MRALHVRATIDQSGSLRVVVPAPRGIAPGEHRAVLIIDDQVQPVRPGPKPPLRLRMLDWKDWPPETTLRREDLYGDDGR